MTLLGVGDFNIGSSGTEPSTMNMSLDEMIASRQQKTRASSRRRGNNTSASSNNNISSNNDPNQVSNVDRSIATSRAKRNAALRARRGLSTNRKASAMEIEQEVQKQGKQTLLERAKNALKKKKSVTFNANLSSDDRAEIRKERRKLARAAAKAKREELEAKRGKTKAFGGAAAATSMGKVADTAPLGRPPSKKAVKAAMTAMEDKGFKIPQGYQMVISFAPSSTAVAANGNSKPAAKKNTNNNNNKGGRRGGRN